MFNKKQQRVRAGRLSCLWVVPLLDRQGSDSSATIQPAQPHTRPATLRTPTTHTHQPRTPTNHAHPPRTLRSPILLFRLLTLNHTPTHTHTQGEHCTATTLSAMLVMRSQGRPHPGARGLAGRWGRRGCPRQRCRKRQRTPGDAREQHAASQAPPVVPRSAAERWSVAWHHRAALRLQLRLQLRLLQALQL